MAPRQIPRVQSPAVDEERRFTAEWHRYLRGIEDAEVYDRKGYGTPENVVAAPVGATFRRLDGGAGTSLYVKESGSDGPTGWIAK